MRAGVVTPASVVTLKDPGTGYAGGLAAGLLRETEHDGSRYHDQCYEGRDPIEPHPILL